VLAGCGVSREILAIDDGSRDATWERLRAECAKRPSLRAIRFTRNFGKEAAMLAGLRLATGAAVVVMDADGQHPPALIPRMLDVWRSGKAQIVAGRKEQRGLDDAWIRVNAWLFNWLARRLTGLDFSGASDFRLLDRRVVDALTAFPERVRFFRGMTAWTGFASESIPFAVEPRIAGASRWDWSQLARLAVTAITSFSAKPLVLIFDLGLMGMLAAAVLFVQALWSWHAGIAGSGWTSLTIVIVFFGSANLLGIGVLGAYLAQLFDEIKARPEYLIAETAGPSSR
ncbi:MAG: glycosyltransferase family 2 protein, partial [Elusimicrobia bacterium]|nr:glycosyltransferase family 2 protein [Elusimicrobiota bacterium]